MSDEKIRRAAEILKEAYDKHGDKDRIIEPEREVLGRYETISWFTKSDKYTFNLDAVRVPQKYPGKTYYRGKNQENG